MRRLDWNRACNAYRRRAARWFGRRMLTLRPSAPVISFTFDDFPRSALDRGGAILEQFGCAGTYYASLGLADSTGLAGEYFRTSDLPHLLAAGHELGCHTFDHCPAWETSPVQFEESVLRNARALWRQLPAVQFRSLSYPISYPRPLTKRRLSRRFDCCRGGGQTCNHGAVDLNYLSAFFLEQCGEDVDVIQRQIAETCAVGGWLIFATHDVTEHPTRFGCTPAFFEAVVAAAAKSGARILPVHQGLQSVRPTT